MNGLLDSIIKQGIASYGARYAESPSEPIMPKGKGYFGLLPSSEGFSTEISATDEYGRHYPLLSPALTQEQINMLLNNQQPTEDIYKAAENWANYRRNAGLDTFASPMELRMPVDVLSGLLGK